MVKIKYSPRSLKEVRLSSYFKVLFAWKGSVYKLLHREFLIFCGLFATISITYRFLMNPEQRVVFEKICNYANEFSSLIPISFVLGFYVSVIIHRWWEQFLAIPWPDRVVYNVAAHIEGDDEAGKLLRRTMVRYVNLSALLVFCAVSQSVKKRFPTLNHIVKAGFMTAEERRIYENVRSPHAKYWIPCLWFVNLVRMAKNEDRIVAPTAVKSIIDELNNFHDHCDAMFGYDWVTIPLVYTQVVTIAVYTYFLACLFGRQYITPTTETTHYIDLYIPLFTLLQFIFYFGWLKVAEDIIDPFGDDDDDFEMNLIVDRNLQTGYLAVDTVRGVTPPIIPDIYIEEEDFEIPHTKASIKTKVPPWLGSANGLRVKKSDQEFGTLDEDIVLETHSNTVELETSNQSHRNSRLRKPQTEVDGEDQTPAEETEIDNDTESSRYCFLYKQDE